MTISRGFDLPPSDEDSGDFEEAKRIIRKSIERCLDNGIEPALVSAVLIGAGVSCYSQYHGEDAMIGVLSQTISDIRTGRHRLA